ncbi:hypothetical protein POV27_12360 [Aureisphaera galaxeae]|uniref:hypothetical protein n=1 Tax=Aureisphaera galaxeae TaxID=1538023 RepID=UPI00234FC044|nr:hypothetical protein [Aureisphaera galaxeae]MDC8004846.1 hypothetical protein [Aureisphaera galaxeae]
MVDQNTKAKTSKILILIGSILLAVMAVFHGSGFFYVSDLIDNSNADGLLKEIVPVLFAHPSIHLIGLAALGIFTLFLTYDARKILYLLTALVLIDTILAFMVGGPIPGSILSVPVLCFAIAGYKIKNYRA